MTVELPGHLGETAGGQAGGRDVEGSPDPVDGEAAENGAGQAGAQVVEFGWEVGGGDQDTVGLMLGAQAEQVEGGLLRSELPAGLAVEVGQGVVMLEKSKHRIHLDWSKDGTTDRIDLQR